MKKLVVISALGLVMVHALESRELRAPLALWRGFVHYPLDHYDDRCNDIDVWGAGYYRFASRAFPCEDTTCKVPLSQLYFGSPSFRLRQAFANGVNTVPGNPFITVSKITPLIEYNEKGAIFGFTSGRRFRNNRVRVGFRARLPVRFVTVRQNASARALQGATAKDLCFTQNERYPLNNPTSNVVNNVYACRLDLISALTTVPGQPLVNYNGTNGRVTIAGIDATNGNTNTAGGADRPGAKVNLVGSPTGARPPRNFGELDTVVNTLPSLPANGQGVGTSRTVFGANVNYSALAQNPDAQAQLYLVPTISTVDQNNFRLTADAAAIHTAIQNAINNLSDGSVIDFLDSEGVTFDTQQIEGLGDLNTELYLGYDFNNCFWGEGHFGVVFPTGKKVCDPGRLLAQPLGNNGHFELRIGGELGYEFSDWLKVRADSSYFFVLRNRESIAAPFTGATVQNIGPAVFADISWSSFLGHVDFTFVPPCMPCLGFDIGYELYAKARDKVRLCQATAANFGGGAQQTLDATVAERDTRRVEHKVRTEVFYNTGYFDVVGGFANTFAGQNIQQETDWYLGLVVSF